MLVEEAKRHGWSGDYDNSWADWDVKLVGDRWHDITCLTATEELGWPNRFTRLRSEVRPTKFNRVAVTATLIWTAASIVSDQAWAMGVGASICVYILFRMNQSRRRCLKAITRLVIHAGRLVNLSPVVLTAPEDGTGDEAESARHMTGIESEHGYSSEEVEIDPDASHELRVD